jgi:hypothetical protein
VYIIERDMGMNYVIEVETLQTAQLVRLLEKNIRKIEGVKSMLVLMHENCIEINGESTIGHKIVEVLNRLPVKCIAFMKS